MNTNRTFLNIFLAISGMLIILAVSILGILEQLSTQTSPAFANARLQVGLIILGFLINQLGVWRLGNRLLGDRRVFLKLRAETDVFIGMVRQLNDARVNGDERAVSNVSERMHDQIAMLIAAAGQKAPATEEELVTAGAAAPAKDDAADLPV